MEANVTELWQIVEAMQLELDSRNTDMDAMWLMVGAILVVCESLVYERHSLCGKRAPLDSRWSDCIPGHSNEPPSIFCA